MSRVMKPTFSGGTPYNTISIERLDGTIETYVNGCGTLMSDRAINLLTKLRTPEDVNNANFR